MPGIRVTRFGAMLPAVKSRNLPEPYAEYVVNARLWNGSLRPFNTPSSPDVGCRVADCRNNGGCDTNAFRSIYRSKDNLYGWCGDVCVVEGQPFYNQDRLILFEDAGSFTPNPTQDYLIDNTLVPFGIPNRPDVAPFVIVYDSQGQEEVQTEEITFAYTPTDLNPADYVGGVGNIDPDDDPQAPTEIRQIIEGDTVEITRDIGPDYQSVTNPQRHPHAFVYTFVSLLGDESAPSPPFYIDPTFSCDSFRVCNFGIPNPDDNVVAIRVYITNTPFEVGNEETPTMAADWFLVGEIPIGEDCLYSELDHNCFQNDLLVTQDDCPPWSCMSCVVELELGALVGWCGCNIYASQRHIYGAWREVNEVTLLANIINAVAYYDTLYVATDRNPYRIQYSVDQTGNIIQEAIPYQEHWPILDSGSMTESTFGAIYSASVGLVALTGDQARLITRNIVNADDWVESYAPDIATWHQGIYYGFRRGTSVGFLFDFNDNSSGQYDKAEFSVINLPEPVHSLHSGKDGRLYIGMGDGIYVWDGGRTDLTYTYRSKEYVLPGLVNWSAAKIVGPYDQGPVIFRLSANGNLKYEREVDTSEPFRLPNCGTYINWQFELEGRSEICEVHISTSIGELREQ